MKGLPLQKQISIINSKDVSVKSGRHQVILEEYKNGDAIHINYNAITKFMLVYIVT
jgi:hypothetical protein